MIYFILYTVCFVGNFTIYWRLLVCSKCISNCGPIFHLFGSKETQISPSISVFFLTVLKPVYVFSRHMCSAVHIL